MKHLLIDGTPISRRIDGLSQYILNVMLNWELARDYEYTLLVRPNECPPLYLRLFKEKGFRVEEVNVLMTHIGGYPGKYNPWLIPMFRKSLDNQEDANHRIDLFVCGHSHILKVQYDSMFHFLTMNPGAAGLQGWQPCQTLLRFTIDGAKIDNLEVIELDKP